jgi:hypothetical protein
VSICRMLQAQYRPPQAPRHSVRSTRFPNGSRQKKRGRPTISPLVRLDAGVFEPASQLLEPGVDAQAEVLQCSSVPASQAAELAAGRGR